MRAEAEASVCHRTEADMLRAEAASSKAAREELMAINVSATRSADDHVANLQREIAELRLLLMSLLIGRRVQRQTTGSGSLTT